MKSRVSSEEAAENKRRHLKRRETIRARLGVRNMNDTKWAEVMDTVFGSRRSSDAFRVHIKFIDSAASRPLGGTIPVNRKWADSDVGPFEYVDIEWLQVKGEGASNVRKALDALGLLPFVQMENGFRIQAYGLLNA